MRISLKQGEKRDILLCAVILFVTCVKLFNRLLALALPNERLLIKIVLYERILFDDFYT